MYVIILLIYAVILPLPFRNKYKDWVLDEKKAKTVARTLGSTKDLYRRKRWSVKAIWGEEEEEEESETRWEFHIHDHFFSLST